MLSEEKEQLERFLPTVGGVALVAYLLVFDGSFGVVGDAPLDGLAGDAAAGGLLILSIFSFAVWFTIYLRN